MKIKSILFFLILLTSAKGITQEEVLNIPIDYKSKFYDKESLVISNENTGDLVLFIEDSKVCKILLLDKDFALISQLQMERLPTTFYNFIGYQINDDNTYLLFFSQKNEKKFGVIRFNFDTDKATLHELDFKLKKEAYVQGISHKGAFYLLTSTRATNDVSFYQFNINTFVKKKTVNFDFLQRRKNDFTLKAYNVLVSRGFNEGSLIKMDNKTPNAIETTSAENKIYQIKDTFIFTFDYDHLNTIVATITPSNDFELKTTTIKKPLLENETDIVNHNSYIYDDKIFQIKSCNTSMKFTVKDLNSQELLKAITLNKEDSITFKNTPIIQEGPAFIAGTKTRKMEATSKFLRKVSAGDIGIAAYKNGNSYRITLGSKKEIQRGGAMMPMGGFGGMPMGGIGPLSFTFNPTFYAYGGYTSTKTVRIDCLFDNEFKHLQGEVPDNVFDNIKAFEDSFEQKSNATSSSNTGYKRFNTNSSNSNSKAELKNLFWHLDKLYFGYLDTKDRSYHLVTFKNN